VIGRKIDPVLRDVDPSCRISCIECGIPLSSAALGSKSRRDMRPNDPECEIEQAIDHEDLSQRAQGT